MTEKYLDLSGHLWLFSFTGIQCAYKIHPVKICNSVVFSIFIVVLSPLPNFKTFLLSPKKFITSHYSFTLPHRKY